MTTKRLIGKRVKVLRLARGLSQEQVAEAASVSVGFVSQLERGVIHPSVPSCERLAEALGVPVKDIFDFDAPVRKLGMREKVLAKLNAVVAGSSKEFIAYLTEVALAAKRFDKKKRF